jgi:cytochrome c556
MKQRLIPTAFTVVAASLALAACSGAEEAAEDTEITEAPASEEPGVIEQRQALLEGMGDSFRDIRDQLEGDADFTAMAASAETIRTNASQFVDLFPEGTSIDSGADTEALPIIWEDPEGFAAAHNRLMEATGTMVDAVASGEVEQVQAAVGTLGGACKNCHDTYRVAQD